MTIELGDDPPPAPVLPDGSRSRAVLDRAGGRVPRRARGGVRGSLGAPADAVRGVVATAAREARLRPVALVHGARRRRSSLRQPATTRSDRAAVGSARSEYAGNGAGVAWRRRCSCTASASFTGAASGVSASESTPRTQPARRSCTRAWAWSSTPNRSSGRRRSHERPSVGRGRRARRRGAHQRRGRPFLRPPRPADRRGHPHVPAVLEGVVGLGGGRPHRRRAPRSAYTAMRRDIQGFVADKGRGIGTEILERGETFARAEGVQKILTGGARARRRGARALRGARLPRGAPLLRDGDRADGGAGGGCRPGWIRRGRAARRRVRGLLRRAERSVRRALGVASEAVRGVARAPAGPAPRRARPRLVRRSRRRRACRRDPQRPDVAGGGYVGAIGVRPAWRGQGLGKALLQRTFAEFRRRGTTRVTLDVDSQNATGAVALYERVGMHVDTCGVAFEKTLA